jgi:hypothetical protein
VIIVRRRSILRSDLHDYFLFSTPSSRLFFQKVVNLFLPDLAGLCERLDCEYAFNLIKT